MYNVHICFGRRISIWPKGYLISNSQTVIDGTHCIFTTFQGSRWTFQATRMNGQIGSWIIKPDQMQLLNPAFILILIPTFDRLIYPFLNK
jgi:hypothetical protein